MLLLDCKSYRKTNPHLIHVSLLSYLNKSAARPYFENLYVDTSANEGHSGPVEFGLNSHLVVWIGNFSGSYEWAEFGSVVSPTVPAEQSLHLIPGLFGFDWVATEYKPGLIMSYTV